MTIIRIVNLQRSKINVETNYHVEISGPNPPMERAAVESIGPEDTLTVDTGREVRIELRGETISVIALG